MPTLSTDEGEYEFYLSKTNRRHKNMTASSTIVKSEFKESDQFSSILNTERQIIPFCIIDPFPSKHDKI